MTDTLKPASLITKLTEVMAAVDRIPKRGKNAHFGYQYATEADVSDVLRAELSKRHVLMVMGITDILNSPSGNQTMTLVRFDVSFHDGDSDAVLTFPWAGAGQDSGEKGLYKAMTGAEKYALLKTFLVPTGDDPENDSDTVKPNSKPLPVATPAQPRAAGDEPDFGPDLDLGPDTPPPATERMTFTDHTVGSPVISEARAKRAYAMGMKGFGDRDRMMNWLRINTPYRELRDILVPHYDQICAKLETGGQQ